MRKARHNSMEILKYIKPTQEKLFNMLKNSFKDVIWKAGRYILVKGEAPVMLVAHLDTVHKNPAKTVCISEDGNILMSPNGIGGDDRCGVYALCSVYKSASKKPWLLFTCDEEVGCVGASDFARDFSSQRLPMELAELKMLIEVDRKGKDDAVYYDCSNQEFEEYITSKGFVTAHGSVSDISYIAPALGVAAVNLSSGYYNAHTTHEYINLAEINATIAKIQGIVEESTSDEVPQFIYESAYDEYGYWFYNCSGYYDKNMDFSAILDDNHQIMYAELMEIYDEEELKAYISDYGPEVLEDIYDAEIGFTTEEKAIFKKK